jgi:hypothetical protein
MRCRQPGHGESPLAPRGGASDNDVVCVHPSILDSTECDRSRGGVVTRLRLHRAPAAGLVSLPAGMLNGESLPTYYDLGDLTIPKKWSVVTRDGCERLSVFVDNKSVPDGDAHRLRIAMSAKAPADNVQMFVNRFHRVAKIFGDFPGAAACSEASDDVHPSICKNQGWIESRAH